MEVVCCFSDSFPVADSYRVCNPEIQIVFSIPNADANIVPEREKGMVLFRTNGSL